MDFSASNAQLWRALLQLALLSAVMLFANVVRRKVPFIRKSLLPTAVVGGFFALVVRLTGLVPLDSKFMETMTYHMTAIGFIALALRMPRRSELTEAARARHDGLKSGILIVCSYLTQGILGLGITMALGYTIMPDLFKAAGLLLPLGYGQGPGQAYNIGNNYQGLGFDGGASFGLGVATMGMLWACIGGVMYLNYLAKKKKLATANIVESGVADGEPVEDPGEVPLTEAVDRFTTQIAMVLMIYLVTYLVSLGLCELIKATPALKGLSVTLIPLIWGFNFLIGTIMATAFKGILAGLKKTRIMTRQYTNNYLLNRISGCAFDLMIIASICAINIDDLQGLWVPFLLICTAGGFYTLWYVRFMSNKLFPGYADEAFFGMYGMMTGTVSTGIILLREVDPGFRTPTSNNLVIGSTSAILLGFPLLLLIGLAPKGDMLLWLTMGLLILYAAVLHAIVLIPVYRKAKRKPPETPPAD